MTKYKGTVDVSGVTENGGPVDLISLAVDSADHGEEATVSIVEQISRGMPNGWAQIGGLFLRLSAYAAITVKFNEPDELNKRTERMDLVRRLRTKKPYKSAVQIAVEDHDVGNLAVVLSQGDYPTFKEIADDVTLSMNDAATEIELLRQAVTRYCDKSRMGTIEPMPVQQAVDRAFETP